MEERGRYQLDRKITVDEFQRLGREGFFPDDVRLELVDGEVHALGDTIESPTIRDLRLPASEILPRD